MILLPLSLYPFVGTFIAAAFKSMSTAQYLHKPVRPRLPLLFVDAYFLDQYFVAKKMTPRQVAVFTEERKWDYRSTNDVSLPISLFTFVVSVRFRCGSPRGPTRDWPDLYDIKRHRSCYVGSWYVCLFCAFMLLTFSSDLEKRQHYVAVQRQRSTD